MGVTYASIPKSESNSGPDEPKNSGGGEPCAHPHRKERRYLERTGAAVRRRTEYRP